MALSENAQVFTHPKDATVVVFPDNTLEGKVGFKEIPCSEEEIADCPPLKDEVSSLSEAFQLCGQGSTKVQGQARKSLKAILEATLFHYQVHDALDKAFVGERPTSKHWEVSEMSEEEARQILDQIADTEDRVHLVLDDWRNHVMKVADLDGNQGKKIWFVQDGKQKYGTLIEGANYEFWLRLEDGEDVPVPLDDVESLRMRLGE